MTLHNAGRLFDLASGISEDQAGSGKLASWAGNDQSHVAPSLTFGPCCCWCFRLDRPAARPAREPAHHSARRS